MPGRKKRKIESEVVVRFRTVQTRDMVVSYAPNLRAWRDQDGSSANATGLRLEIPDHLMGTFKVLERYGHHLKARHGEGLRRHIRFDDYNSTLVMDYALPNKDTWERTDFENAREEMRGQQPMYSQRPRSSSDGGTKPWGVPQHERDTSVPAEGWGDGEKQEQHQQGHNEQRSQTEDDVMEEET